MADYLIRKTNMQSFISQAGRDYTVYAPLKNKEHYTFGKLGDGEAVSLDQAAMTMLPPSKILIKSKETVLRFPAGTEKNIEPPEFENIMIFGARPCDLQGLALLDEIFFEPITDRFYESKRDRSFIIGLKCQEACDSFKTVPQNNNRIVYDLMLEDIGDSFLLLTGSEKGCELIQDERFAPFIEKTQISEGPAAPCRREAATDPEKLAEAIEASRGDKIWQEVADICLGCGICSYVCPLCYCFETENDIDIEGNIRCGRRWDSCFLPGFFRVAGHDFRKNLADRLFNWYYHKFVRAVAERGRADCVACGRCVRYCPAGIDFTQVLEKIEGAYMTETREYGKD